MFKLLRHFWLTSFLVIGLAVAFLAVLDYRGEIDALVGSKQRENETLTRLYANAVWPGMTSYVAEAAGVAADALKTHPQVQAIDRAVRELGEGLPVLKVKIFSPEGLTLYSSEPAQIGSNASRNQGFLIASRQGKAASELVFQGRFSAFHGVVENRNLVSTYVPIRGPQGGLDGVFEVYSDATLLLADIRWHTLDFAARLTLVFAFLYGALFLIVRRADRIIGVRTAELGASEAQLHAVIDHSPSIIHLKDPSGRFVLVNRAFEELVGLRREAVIGKTTHDLYPRPVADELVAEDRRVIATMSPITRDRERTWNDGPVRVRHYVKFPVSRQDGRLAWVGTISTDITERKRVEEDLRLAKDGAEAANRAKTEFLARMSHELRTPLNAILGFAQLLELGANDPLTERQKGYVEPILTAGRHLLGLIEEILDLTRVESGAPIDSVGEVSSRAMLVEALAFVRPMAEKSGIRVIDESPSGELPWVRVDPVRAKQALLNLLTNAIKFNRPAGSMTVRAAVDGDGTLRLSVADTGPGIPEGRQAELFKPFSRLDADARGVQGTGLGLAITKQLIERMGGRVGFSSVEGRGSTFWIDLPLAGAPRLDGDGRG